MTTTKDIMRSIELRQPLGKRGGGSCFGVTDPRYLWPSAQPIPLLSEYRIVYCPAYQGRLLPATKHIAKAYSKQDALVIFKQRLAIKGKLTLKKLRAVGVEMIKASNGTPVYPAKRGPKGNLNAHL